MAKLKLFPFMYALISVLVSPTLQTANRTISSFVTLAALLPKATAILETPPTIFHYYEEEIENVVQVDWTPTHDREPYPEAERRLDRTQDFPLAIDNPQPRQTYVEHLPSLPRERNVPLDLWGLGTHLNNTGDNEYHAGLVPYNRDSVLAQFNRDLEDETLRDGAAVSSPNELPIHNSTDAHTSGRNEISTIVLDRSNHNSTVPDDSSGVSPAHAARSSLPAKRLWNTNDDAPRPSPPRRLQPDLDDLWTRHQRRNNLASIQAQRDRAQLQQKKSSLSPFQPERLRFESSREPESGRSRARARARAAVIAAAASLLWVAKEDPRQQRRTFDNETEANNLDARWVQHQRRNHMSMHSWACVFCVDRKVFSSLDDLFEHGHRTHQDEFPQDASEEDFERFLLRYGVDSGLKRTPIWLLTAVSPSPPRSNNADLNGHDEVESICSCSSLQVEADDADDCYSNFSGQSLHVEHDAQSFLSDDVLQGTVSTGDKDNGALGSDGVMEPDSDAGSSGAESSENLTEPSGEQIRSAQTSEFSSLSQQGLGVLDRWFSEENDKPFLALGSPTGMARELRDISILNVFKTNREDESNLASEDSTIYPLADVLDALLRSCHHTSDDITPLGSSDIRISEKPLIDASIGSAGELQDIPTLGSFVLVDNELTRLNLDHLIPESANDLSQTTTQARSDLLWDPIEPLWLHESESGPLSICSEGLFSDMIEPGEISSWSFSPADFKFDYEPKLKTLVDSIHSTPDFVNPSEIMTSNYRAMRQDQQLDFQPSQLTVMACENQGNEGGEETHDKFDEDEEIVDNDLEKISSKPISPRDMMKPKSNASLTYLHNLDGKNANIDTAECSTSIATMTSPFSTSSMSPQSSNEKRRFHHACNQCHKPFRRICDLRKHFKRVHTKAFPCPIEDCPRAFGGKQELVRHQKGQHSDVFGKDEFECEDCGKVYARKEYLRRHVRMKHGGEDGKSKEEQTGDKNKK